MPPTRPLKVFLCYASADKPAVRKLYRYLKERKINPWFGEINLLAGQNWREEIPKAIKNSEAIIVLLSKNSINKEGYVQREIKFALDKAAEMPSGKIFLIPAKLEECDAPDELADYQWVNLFEEDGSRRLLKSLRLRAEQVGATRISTSGQDTNLPPISPETQKDSSIDVDDNVSRTNIAVDNNNVVHVMSKSELASSMNYDTEKKPKAIQKTEQEKTNKDVLEKVERERIKLEAKKVLARENAERVALAKATREKTEQESKEKLARENSEGDDAEKENYETRFESIVEKPVAIELEPNKRLGTKIRLWGTGMIVFTILAFIVWDYFSLYTFIKPTLTPSAKQTLFVESETGTPASVINNVTIEPTPTIMVTIGKDDAVLVYVPEGEFTMGLKDTDLPSYDDEKPQHPVTLNAFWINQTEVTNKQYRACVDAGICEPPSSISSYTHLDYFENPEFDDFPVIYVNWDKANRYCEVWADGDLPTEAQWEKAARGTDARIYPWGNDTPNNYLLNYNSSIGETTKVGSYERGKSFYGVYDMAGNVWEWVNDWYGETYYQNSPVSNPLGPSSGESRVLRGGSWYGYDYYVRSGGRYGYLPSSSSIFIGFRCARSLP